MSLQPTAFPQTSYPFVDKNGILTQPWLQFLLALYRRTGGSVPDTATDSSLQALMMPLLPDLGDASRSFAVASIELTGSPFLFRALTSGMLLISGGAVSLLEYSRDGTDFFSTGSFYGAFPMRKMDQMRLSYVSSGPVVTFIPM